MPHTPFVRLEDSERRGVSRLVAEVWIPERIDKVFAFFSDATKLEQITPPWTQFHMTTPLPIDIREGAIIDYRLKIHGVPLKWRSEISNWQPPFRFVDSQLRGPYRMWRHEHTFQEQDGGTIVGDRVEYSVPGGRFVDKLFVRRDLQRIFEHRQQALLRVFHSKPTDGRPWVSPT